MSPQDDKNYSVRLQASAGLAVDSLIQLHHRLQHIPEATPSAYLKFLITQDAEKMRDEVKKRRSRVTT